VPRLPELSKKITELEKRLYDLELRSSRDVEKDSN